MEWDTAAGQAVLQAAGGRVLTLNGEPLCYGKPGFENPHFVAEALNPERDVMSSMAVTHKSGLVVGARSFPGSP